MTRTMVIWTNMNDVEKKEHSCCPLYSCVKRIHLHRARRIEGLSCSFLVSGNCIILSSIAQRNSKQYCQTNNFDAILFPIIFASIYFLKIQILFVRWLLLLFSICFMHSNLFYAHHHFGIISGKFCSLIRYWTLKKTGKRPKQYEFHR